MREVRESEREKKRESEKVCEREKVRKPNRAFKAKVTKNVFFFGQE